MERRGEESGKRMLAQSYREIMRHQAGAVTVIAAGAAGGRAGLTATAVCSLSDDPPTLLACVNRKAGAHPVIETERVFSINLLAADQQAIADCFSGRTGIKGEARFGVGTWRTARTGAPILAGALASLECRIEEQHSFSTHTIFIGRVVDAIVVAHAAPLLYFRGDYWDLGSR